MGLCLPCTEVIGVRLSALPPRGKPPQKDNDMTRTDIDIDKEVEALDDMTPEKLAEHIRDLVLDSRKARAHRNDKRAIRKGDLRALAAWERDLTSNYGIKR